MLPIRTNVDDITQTCVYLNTKATGAKIRDISAAIGEKYSDTRKLNALKVWSFIEDSGDRLKVTERGRRYAKGDSNVRASLTGDVIRSIPAYMSVVERAAHRRETSLTSTEVAAHLHEHFRGEVADNDETLNDQAVCLLQLATGANLGKLVIGRRGSSTRFDFDMQALEAFVGSVPEPTDVADVEGVSDQTSATLSASQPPSAGATPNLGQAIFIAHGRNKKPLEQLKTILDQFGVPYKVAVDEPNLGRPIGTKVRETMDACNCAIAIFTADEEFFDKDGKSIWRPSQNVVYELGAASYLYGKRIVIMKEDRVEFPSDFRDIGYISFECDELSAKAMEVMKELIGFGIIKIST